MIKQLRKQFITSAIISIAVVLALLMVVVNVINYINIYAELDEVTAMIAENEGKIPDFRWDSGSPEIFPNFENFSEKETPGAPPETGNVAPPETEASPTVSQNNEKTSVSADSEERTEAESTVNQKETTTEQATTIPAETFNPNNGNNPRYSEADAPKHFNEESSYATRFFSITYDGEGNLISYNMENIASVDSSDAETYVEFAMSKGVGKGNMGDYRYYITQKEDGTYIAVFLNASSQFRSARQYILFSIIAFVVGLLLAAVLIIVFSKKAIKPTVKAMEQQKQFITNASHELKTPLTVMSTNLKLLEMDMGKQKWIDKTEQQVQTLTELINDMVVLSRLDEEHPALMFLNFNISDMVEQTAEEFEDVAISTGHNMKLEIESELMYHGDQATIRQMISILFDNAFKYAAPESDVYVKLYAEKKHVFIKVSNGCLNISEEDLAHLFDRFYRADRSHSKETKGFGIGLSIVRSVAENHKGQADVKLIDPEHIEFTISLRNNIQK